MKLGYVLLYVGDVKQTMRFYAEAFGLEEGSVFESDGHGEYGEMITGETKLGFVRHATASSHGFSYETVTPAGKPPGIELGLVTRDVKGAYERAVKAGAMPVSEPKSKPWGQVVSYVRDCNGFLVELCSPMGG